MSASLHLQNGGQSGSLKPSAVRPIELPPPGYIYVLCVPLLAGIGAVRGISLGPFNYTGFLWLGAFAVGIALLLVESSLRPQQRSYYPVGPWLAWSALLTASLCWAIDCGVAQIQDHLQICMPILIGGVAAVFVRNRTQLRQLFTAYYATLVLGLFFTALWAFKILGNGPEGIYVAVRPLSMTAVVIAALLIAGAEKNFWQAWLGWAACMSIPVITGSRMATLAMLAVPLLNPASRNYGRKLVAVFLISGLGALVYFSPIFQERFFHGAEGGINDIASGNFDDAGRFDVWPIVMEECYKRPWLGHGIGTVQYIIAEVWVDQTHPHNDYLRVAYEVGLVGLLLLMFALLWQFWHLRLWILQSTGPARQALAAVWISLALFLLFALTDNPIVYNIWFMNPIFALMGAGYSIAYRERVGELQGDPSR